MLCCFMATIENQLTKTPVHQMKSISTYTNASATNPESLHIDPKLQVSPLETSQGLPS